jgi:hypothetical protein
MRKSVLKAARVSVAQKLVVPEAGIEPARLAAGDFESPASTNFTTPAVWSHVHYPTVNLSFLHGCRQCEQTSWHHASRSS